MSNLKKKYVALLLGINVGGNRLIKMADLKAVFEKMNFGNVKTLLASGNVIFESDETDKQSLINKIESAIEKRFGFTVQIILRSVAEIKKIIESEPFKGEIVDKNTRLYVLFLSSKNTSTLSLPCTSPLHDFRILRIDDFEVYCVLNLKPATKTVDCMKILAKEFGKQTTMRNWNTVLKLVK